MAEYTAFVEAGNALCELLRDTMTPEPISNRELIALCSPHESENNQLTVYMFHIEEEPQNGNSGYIPQDRDTMRLAPSRFQANFLVTAHSKAPARMKEADQYRMIGSVIQIIKDNPVIDSKYLEGSAAENKLEMHTSLEKPNFDQMMKIWNSTSAPYRLSVVIKVSGIILDSKKTKKVGRVRDVKISTEEKNNN